MSHDELFLIFLALTSYGYASYTIRLGNSNETTREKEDYHANEVDDCICSAHLLVSLLYCFVPNQVLYSLPSRVLHQTGLKIKELRVKSASFHQLLVLTLLCYLPIV